MLCVNISRMLLAHTPHLIHLHIPKIYFQLGLGSGSPPHLVLGSPLSMSWGFLLQLIIYRLLLKPRHVWCPFFAFTAFRGATAQCQQLEHYQGLQREKKESWELTVMGTKGDMSTWAILGLQPPKSTAGMFHPHPQSWHIPVGFSTDQETLGSFCWIFMA